MIINVVSVVLVFYLLILVLLYIANKRYIKKSIGPYKLILINCFVAYIVAMLMVFGQEIYLDYKLAQFDLNGDGMFTDNEITLDQEKAFKRVIHDTGRSLAPFTFGALTIAYGFIMSFLYLTYGIISNALNKTKNT